MSSPSDPVEITCRSFWICDSPIFMIEPLPNCFSICCSAAVKALLFSLSICFPGVEGGPGVSGLACVREQICKMATPTRQCVKLWHRTIVRCHPSNGLIQAVEQALQSGIDGGQPDALAVAGKV